MPCLYKAPEDISVKNTAIHLFLKGLSNRIVLLFEPVILETLISRFELMPFTVIRLFNNFIICKN